MKKRDHDFDKESPKSSLCVICRIVEISFIIVVSVCLVRLAARSPSRFSWILPWVILVGASLLPTWFRGERLSAIGIRVGDLVLSLRWVAIACVVFFPFIIFAFWYCSRNGVTMPLSPKIPKEQFMSWGLYQFLYVSVSEEVFFRGYVMSGVLRLLSRNSIDKSRRRMIVAVVIVSAVFGASHIVVTGDVLSGVAFFPGLIFGWLFIRTRSLVAPVLFHGLSNCLYGGLSVVFY